MEELLNYIGGKWQRSQAERRGSNINPARTKEILNFYQVSGPQDVLAAIDAAHHAFEEWRRVPAPKRGEIVARATENMRARREDYARVLTQEEGKIYGEALGELDRSIANMHFSSGQGLRLGGKTIPSAFPDVLIYTQRDPLGVVGIITPWNFPVSIPAWKIAPALVAGNTVVFKPASLTPWTAHLLIECYEKAGLPPGVLNLVTGSGSEVGNILADDERIKAISFTGSNEVGQKLYARAAQRMCRVQLELGGKNPVIVLEDADLEQAADGVAMGAFGSTGQRCTCTSRVIVLEQVADRFTEAMVERARKVRTGYGLEEGITMGPVVDENQFTTVHAGIEMGLKEGARLLVDGREPSRRELKEGYFIEPTIFTDVQPAMRLHQEEIFGPVLAMVKVRTFEEAIKAANNVKYGLSSSIYTRDLGRAMDYTRQSEVGMLHVNLPTLGGEAQVPFGGSKASGLGARECGEAAFDFFTEERVVYLGKPGH